MARFRIRLFHERGDEITRTTGGTYRVPSCSGEASYHVYLGEITTCSCPDSRRAREAGEYCKHVHAAAVFAAKRRAARRRRVTAAWSGHATGQGAAKPPHHPGDVQPCAPLPLTGGRASL